MNYYTVKACLGRIVMPVYIASAWELDATWLQRGPAANVRMRERPRWPEVELAGVGGGLGVAAHPIPESATAPVLVLAPAAQGSPEVPRRAILLTC